MSMIIIITLHYITANKVELFFLGRCDKIYENNRHKYVIEKIYWKNKLASFILTWQEMWCKNNMEFKMFKPKC